MTDAVHSEEGNPSTASRGGASNGIGASSNNSRSDSVTCPSCHVTVTLSKGLESRRRLVCPYCGATYSHHESQLRAVPNDRSDPLRHLRLPIVVRPLFSVFPQIFYNRPSLICVKIDIKCPKRLGTGVDIYFKKERSLHLNIFTNSKLCM